jgi:hypothetical protein
VIENGARRHHPIQALEVCDVSIVAKGKDAAIRNLFGEQGLRPGQQLFFMSPGSLSVAREAVDEDDAARCE